jgi:pyruvate dehydrogenase E2 component (dihydrolipoamide acetyltransferase)
MTDIVMPRLSDTMEEGTILRWLKGEGEQIARGEELVEIETDKATMVYESDQAGTLSLIAREGETLPVGAPIASVGDGAAVAPSSDEKDDRGGERVGPVAHEEGSKEPAEERAAPTAPPVAGERTPAPGERIRASPLARRLASERGVDLATLQGSGPGGRIVRADVPGGEAASHSAPSAQETNGAAERRSGADRRAAASAGTPAPGAVATAKGETREVELSRTQQTVSRRMAESKATIPDFTLQAEVDMEACVALRAELKVVTHESEGERAPTYNDMVVKACALALREFPQANGSYRDGRLQLYSRINVGVAVAADASLVVPTVFDAAEKSLGEIARETRALAERVRDGSITPPELGGGTFTVSNLGMYGVRSFTAIINPPQAAIMSVGALEPRAVVRDGQVVARHTMSLTLVCDHRILYGAEAASFLARVRELLQTPASLTL